MVKGFKRRDEILEKHGAEIAKLREDFNKMLKVVRGLQEGHVRLEKKLSSLENTMIGGFGELRFAGITFEDFVRKFLPALLRKEGKMEEVFRSVSVIIYNGRKNLYRRVGFN